MRRQVVITGLGVVSALGTGAAALWEGLCAGKSGVGPITRFDPAGFESRVAGQVKDLSARDFVPKSYRKAVKVMARDIELAVAAAKLAVEDAKIATRGTSDAENAPTTYPSERMGCHIGAGLIAAEAEELTSALATAAEGGKFDLKRWGTGEGGGGGMNNLQPLWMLKYLPNMLACHVTIIHGAEGPSNTLTCAEASGLLCIGESARVIERDAADLCFSGGAESKINLLGMLRMTFAQRLGPSGEADGSKCRPFSPDSVGVLGEGGGIVILEAEESAKARGQPPYARIHGFGAAQSLHPGIPPAPAYATDGLQLAIESALRDAGISAADIDAIVPHGCGNPAMDRSELVAMQAVFGSRLERIPVVTWAPNIGDCFAADGGIATAIGAMMVREQRIPARLGASQTPGLDAAASATRSVELRNVLICTNGFGGQNAALVLGRV
jgi:3-oxoacyl-[acyl-carrier-protein] synthase II